jgi:hypothetical protein
LRIRRHRRLPKVRHLFWRVKLFIFHPYIAPDIDIRLLLTSTLVHLLFDC